MFVGFWCKQFTVSPKRVLQKKRSLESHLLLKAIFQLKNQLQIWFM